MPSCRHSSGFAIQTAVVRQSARVLMQTPCSYVQLPSSAQAFEARQAAASRAQHNPAAATHCPEYAQASLAAQAVSLAAEHRPSRATHQPELLHEASHSASTTIRFADALRQIPSRSWQNPRSVQMVASRQSSSPSARQCEPLLSHNPSSAHSGESAQGLEHPVTVTADKTSTAYRMIGKTMSSATDGGP